MYIKKEYFAFFLLLIILLFSGFTLFKKKSNLSYSQERIKMVDNQIEFRGIKDKTLLQVMKKVPRHKFVPNDYKNSAYDDRPLPIGFGQTISQPYIVALMTELLKVKKNYKVLEIGTGSGYQAAVLSELVKQVYTIEIVKPLYDRVNATFKASGYVNIKTKFADGYYGWKENAPYDAIIVTCAASFIPPALIKQLKVGGVMCIPVGPPFKVQNLLLVKKQNEKEVKVEVVTQVIFVPLVRNKE